MLLPRHRAVFRSVPKCGTNTMYAVLAEHYGGERCGGERCGGFHHQRVPDHAADWFRFTVVRNPYDRALSLWRSTCQRPGDRYGFKRRCGDPDSFEAFMRFVVTERPTTAMLGPTQSDILRGKVHDAVLRLERLAEDFALLPFYGGAPAQWPALNATRGERDMTDGARQMVNEWAREDFDQFGYEMHNAE